MVLFLFFFFKQKTAYEMRISDWSSDVCSSDLNERAALSKTTIKFTLAEDAELRSTMAGEKIVHLIGNTPDGRDARAVYKAPSYITDSSVFSVTAKLNAGRTVELVGYWRKRNWKDRNGKAQSVWEFQTMTLLAHA